MKEIGASEFKKLIKRGIENIFRERERMNRINVFPVPDGDTGDNLASTLKPLHEQIDLSQDQGVDELAASLSRRMLATAKGNSGVILSQFFSGFAKALRGKKIIKTTDFGHALERAAEETYLAIETPKEGTILTVIRHAAQEFKKRAQKEEYFQKVFDWASGKTREILERTREMLPQLKKAQVVDAGGLGFYLFFEGMAQAVSGREEQATALPDAAPDLAQLKGEVQDDGICAEWIIRPRRDKSFFRELLHGHGGSLVIAGDEGLLHIHLHTQDPEKVDGALGEHAEIVSRKWETIYEHRRFSPLPDVSLLVDSAIDLPDEFKKRNAVGVIPLQLSLDGTFFREGRDISKEEFYRRMVERPDMAMKTSQPSVGDFLDAYESVLRNGGNILVFSISSLVSGTHQGARMAFHQLPPEQQARLHLVDTLNVSAGSGLLVGHALEMLQGGSGIAQVRAEIARLAPLVVSLGYVENLDYAVRGGRIPKSVGFLARLLRLRALIAFEGGRLVKKGVTFKSRRIERKMARKFARKLEAGKTYSIGIAYTDDPSVAERLESELRRTGLSFHAIWRVCAAAVLGVHAGPGTFCLWALPED